MDYFDGILVRANNVSIAVMFASAFVSILTGFILVVEGEDNDMISYLKGIQRTFKLSLITFAIACGFYILIGE